jgi:probable HAF family extracellular repeat protein
MLNSKLYLLFSLLLALAHSAHADSAAKPPVPANAKVLYSVTEISGLPNVADDVEVSINDSGEIAFWRANPDGTTQAFTWQNNKLRQLGALKGDGSSISHAINSHGDVVGWSVSGKNLVDSTNTVHAFVYSRGRFKQIGTLGGRDSQANGINDDGTVVGCASLAPARKHAFIYKQGKLTDLGILPNGTYSDASAINNSGVIVGTCDMNRMDIHAVMWTNTGIVDLGTLPQGKRSRALAVNNKGDVVGFSEVEAGEIHAFIYTGGKMVDLGDLGDDPVRANGINDSDQVVGMGSVSEFVQHAFIWQNGKIQDLNGLVPKDSGWRIRQAYAINNAGQIVCDGIPAVDDTSPRAADGSASPMGNHLLLLTPVGSAN